MSWIVLYLKCKDESLYTGITNDLVNRLIAHETGKGAKYTKGRGPFTLMYQENYETRSLASKQEIYIKSLNRTEKLKLCLS